MDDDKAIKILTNHWGQKASPTWGKYTTYLHPEGFGLMSSLKLALRLYGMRRGFDCVVLGAGLSDILFALMQSLLPFKKVPCVMIDCIWYENPNRLKRYLMKTVLKIASKSVNTFVVWAGREIDAYSKAFGIPSEKFIFVPYHTTSDTFDIKPSEGNYVFSGGNFGRDYDSFIAAVRGLPVKVLIASTRSDLFSHMVLPENVEVKGFSNEEFLKKMAGCLINVVPLDADLLHSGGQQTFLNSMWFGKPTVVNDPDGAADYIRDGEDGLLVPQKDPAALRSAIEFLLNNPEKRRAMGTRAAIKAKGFSTEEHFKKIISVAREAIEKR